jgi:tight adherence protein B
VCAAAAALPTAAAADELELTPVTRLPFPERGYVVSSAEGNAIGAGAIVVRENGSVVRDLRVSPIATSGIRFGVVLAIDASESMAGAPYEGALRAAAAFLGHRQPGEELAFVAFNGQVTVVRAPTQDDATLAEALDDPPALAYGTRIYDALDRSLRLLRNARIAAGSIVLLSDGADLGSAKDLDDVVAAAQRQRVRIFTVGLRSEAFEDEALRELAEGTGAAYAEAGSPEELEAIYETLGSRLSSEYLVRYRSDARPESNVEVEVSAAGVGDAELDYVAPTPSGVAPYHRSFLTRFVLSSTSIFAVGLLVAALLGWAVSLLLRGPKRDLVERVQAFSSEPPRVRTEREPDAVAAARRALASTRQRSGLWASLERDLEIARIGYTPTQVAGATCASALVLVVLLATRSPVLAVLGLLVPPLVARSVIRHRLNGVRNEFADQLPAALQVLASALRAGHSFSGALGVVVENVREPARSELRRIAHDDQLGVVPEVAIRRIADRMANRDLEQVALLAELQRTAGGNSAEVLDTVVETIRQRSELRRLVRTLTAQGRMARWILTALPIVLGLFLWFMQPEIMESFFGSDGGQVALLAAVLMVAAGSMVIQRIIDIDV